MKIENERLVNALMETRFLGNDDCPHCGFEIEGDICSEIGCSDWDEDEIYNVQHMLDGEEWDKLVRENVEKFADSA